MSRHSIGRRLIKSNDEPIKYLWNRMQAAQSTSNPSCSFPAMVTPCLPLGDPLEGWFCALVEHTFICIYIHTYMCIYTYVYVYTCIILHQEERGECPSIESPSAVVPINASPPRVSRSVVLSPLSLSMILILSVTGNFFLASRLKCQSTARRVLAGREGRINNLADARR